jgi:para-aminobenzoate synthetase/4-amino-4-deoxychorismate lyase
MTVRCRFDDLVAGRAIELTDPSRICTTTSVDSVIEVLLDVDRAIASGACVAGFVAYEAAPAFDPALKVSAAGDRALPLVWFGVFDERRSTTVVAPPVRALDIEWRWMTSRSQYERAFALVQSEIAAGWTYQVNLTAQLAAGFSGEPIDLYRQLVHGQHGAHHGLIETDAFAIASGSPELFFAVEDGMVTTRPMKGTAPRGRFPDEDRSFSDALVTSEKERAENVMIVDLLRNDLGKVAPSGAVETPSLFTLEQYPTVWQLTSTVRAQVGEVALSTLFAKLFPCGSVTGAPKASTMAIIARLEGVARGPYCGAVGWADGGGGGLKASFAVPIRTAVVDRVGRRATYGVGSGVTVDSTVSGEWSELVAKASILTEPTIPQALLETFRFRPGTGFIHLDRHLRRLAASAEHLNYPFDRHRIDVALSGVARSREERRVRLLLSPIGEVTVEANALEPDLERPVRLGIARTPVDRRDRRLFLKTADRARYDDLAAEVDGDVDDVVLWNLEEEVTETSRANLLVLIDGRWWTPPLSCGLLPGVGRAILLEEGVVDERVITLDALRSAERIEVVSSLRSRRSAIVVDGLVAQHASMPVVVR